MAALPPWKGRRNTENCGKCSLARPSHPQITRITSAAGGLESCPTPSGILGNVVRNTRFKANFSSRVCLSSWPPSELESVLLVACAGRITSGPGVRGRGPRSSQKGEPYLCCPLPRFPDSFQGVRGDMQQAWMLGRKSVSVGQEASLL